jgi:DNA-directed RNA polymerase subunit omega
MARITIEDCMEKVPNRFQLVRMAAIRAKQLKKGARPLIEHTENKAVVTSLREIAAGLVKPGDVEVPPAPLETLATEEAVVEASAVDDAEGASAAETPEPVVEG